jgi:hypothetical protein
MIETILSGLPTIVFAVAVALCITCVIIGCVAGIARLWVYNRVLGCVASVTCIVVAVLILSYFEGVAPA